MAKPPASLLDVLPEFIGLTIRDLAASRSHPSRLFTDTAEPLAVQHARLANLYRKSFFARLSPDAARDHVTDIVVEAIGDVDRTLVDAVVAALFQMIWRLFEDNQLTVAFPDLDGSLVGNSNYAMPLRRELEALEPQLANDAAIADAFVHVATSIVSGVCNQYLPDAAFQDDETAGSMSFEVPLSTMIPDVRDLVAAILHCLIADLPHNREPQSRALQHTRNQLFGNMIAASGLSLEQAQKSQHKVVLPAASPLDGAKLIDAYLGSTPFADFLQASVPLSIPRALFAEHGCCFAPSGHGKSQLLQTVVLDLLNDSDPPALFILDSHGDLLRKIERLDCFHPDTGRLRDRLLILDPEDEQPPALNFFAIGSSRTESYGRLHREALEAGIDELFMYLFAALDREFTGKQATAVTYLIRLLAKIDGATIRTLLEVMQEPARSIEQSKYASVIATLDPLAQDFFRTQFFSKDMAPTRQQVASRLFTLLGNRTFDRMFGARENRFDPFAAMQAKKIVLVNTSMLALRAHASSLFGRYVIAQCLAAAFERVTVPESERHLALLIIDEASQYFDDKTEVILAEARKYKLGLFFATQHIEQMPETVRRAVAGNTAIKLAGPVSLADARYLAAEMYTTPEFIRSMRKADNRATEFAGYLRGITPHAIKLNVPFGLMEKSPRMNDAEHERMRALNREHVGAREVVVQPAPPPAPAETHQIEDDDSIQPHFYTDE